jgi:hypothetical protein
VEETRPDAIRPKPTISDIPADSMGRRLTRSGNPAALVGSRAVATSFMAVPEVVLVPGFTKFGWNSRHPHGSTGTLPELAYAGESIERAHTSLSIAGAIVIRRVPCQPTILPRDVGSSAS